MAGKSSFRQPIRHGIDTGTPATTGLGYAALTQYAEVSAAETSATTKFVLPQTQSEGGTFTADILSIDIFVKDVIEDSAQAVLEFTLGSAAGTSLGEIRVSAAGTYNVTPGSKMSVAGARETTGVSADAFFDITGPQPILVNVSAAGTSPDAGFAHMVLNYTVR